MNWLGKVFVVLILIMSLVFMGLAMAVYATHKNWKTVGRRLANAASDGSERGKRAAQDGPQSPRRGARRPRSRRPSSRSASWKPSASRWPIATCRFRPSSTSSSKQQREHIAAVAATQELNKGLTTEVTGLRQQIRTEQQARDAAVRRHARRHRGAAPGQRRIRNGSRSATSSSRSRSPA